ncbi:hypothetical protein ACHAWT_007530, partial [Skeletonema menzelii]
MMTKSTSNNNNNNMATITSPHQMAQLKILSHQARAQIAKMKQTRAAIKQVQQVESQRVADIAASVDVPFEDDDDGYVDRCCVEEEDGVGGDGDDVCGGCEGGIAAAINGGEDATTTNITAVDYNNLNNRSTKKTLQKRYKDKDGFIYYRRVGTKHYKKLFEKGLVPKDNDGDDKVVERVNAIQMIGTGEAEAEVEAVVHHPQPMVGEEGGNEVQEDGVVEEDNGEEEVLMGEESKEQEEDQSNDVPLSVVRQQQKTQLLYSHEEETTKTTREVNINASDGYELRVVPHEDGNDFHVELIKPDVEKVESLKQQSFVVGESCSLSFMESEKVGESGVEVGTVGGGSKKNKNVGEFDTAVDSILDAAETIAKRASPSSSPIALPQSQFEPTEHSNLPGISSLTKRKCADMIQGYQDEKRQRSNSVVSFNPRAYPASNTYLYPPPDTVGASPPSHEARIADPSPQSNDAGPAPNNAYSQIISQDRKEKRGRRTYCYPHPSVDLTEYYSSRQVTKTKKEELTALALCAASHIQKEPVLFRAILLNMALERDRDSPKRHSGGAPTHLKNLALKRHSSQNS